MADLTRQIAIGAAWTNITAAGSLSAGTSYDGDILVADSAGEYATVYQAATDNTTPPSVSVIGHPWIPPRNDSAAPPRRITAESGQVVWMRVEHGTATLVLTEV